MRKVLIVNNCLFIGGAEKLLFELAVFCRSQGLEPVVLILDNYEIEHYDKLLKELKIEVIRVRLSTLIHFRKPLYMIRSILWFIRLKYFAAKTYESIQVIGLHNVDKVYHVIRHPHRSFWNVNNTIQFYNKIYPYQDFMLRNPDDTIVCINEYEIDELYNQYGRDVIKSEIKLFKLFLNDTD